MGFRSGAEGFEKFDWRITRRLLSYVIPHKRRVYISMFLMLLNVGASLSFAPAIRYVIDEGIKAGSFRNIWQAILVLMLIQVIGFFGFRFQMLIMAKAGQAVIQELRDELFAQLQRLSISFFADYETGRIIARVISDVNLLRELITWALVGTVRDLLILLGIFISMLIFSFPLTILSFGIIIVLSVIANVWRIHARKIYLLVRESNASVNSELAEAFNGVRVTQSYTREDFNQQRFIGEINHAHLRNNTKAAMVASLFFTSIELVGGIALGLIVAVGGTLILDGELTVGVLVMFTVYIEQFFFPIRMLAQRYNLFQAVMAACHKIFDLLDRKQDVKDAPDAYAMPQIEGTIRFENVSFQYQDEGEEILHDIDFAVPPKTTIALVGHTGAGKTTIIKLIQRFYDVSSGSITVDGHDLRKVTQFSLRNQMGAVLQESHLFSGSIQDNIRFGRLNATDEEVETAAREIGAHDFIRKLPEGYETELSEGGTSLSTGQKQLISLARAYLADPRILILDEATSNIDTKTERIIQNGLAHLLQDRTSIVIAHRLSTITNADIIIVLEAGEIMEMGSHHELLEHDGIYRRLYTMADLQEA
ncbi:MAG: ABC transporter ATP-binding protein [Chloroflexi bacterium]|nr:ABC transporter ATP-binding protein [Chloroflexota bacterium]